MFTIGCVFKEVVGCGCDDEHEEYTNALVKINSVYRLCQVG